ncbi:MAG: hypothetical protein L0H94_06905 [Nitrospira sp.]|nr:hypothetical protein [Nitrospira sp.]
MKRNYHHIKVAFRMMGLTEEQLQDLKSQVSSVRKVKIGQYHKNPKLFVASFRIQKGKQYNDLCIFLKKTKISEDSYGLWISILTTKTISGVRVPKHVLKLYEKTGGLIDFNFDSG